MPEVFHDGVSLFLRHVSVHGADGEVGLAHLLSQPVDLPLGVAEDDGLYKKKLVKILNIFQYLWFDMVKLLKKCD